MRVFEGVMILERRAILRPLSRLTKVASTESPGEVKGICISWTGFPPSRE